MASAAAASADTGTISATAAAGAAHVWEETGQHTWERDVQEDAQGNLIVAGGESEADAIRRRRKRLEQNDYAQRNRRVVRDMIRYLYILVDASRWVREKDPVLPPGTRIEALIPILQDFVSEFYDQNPLSHLGFVLCKNGEAEILTQLSSRKATHKMALTSVTELASSEGPSGGGEFSLQNGLEVAGRSLGHQPRHGSREIVLVCSALSTCDPGHVLTETLPRLRAANIRVSTLALSAEMHVCRKIAEETGGSLGVCLDKAHLRDWLLGQCIPPPALRRQVEDIGCEMVQMGFPTRTKSDIPSLVHATKDTKVLARTAYTCPQCRAKVSDLPTDCVVCGLKLVLSPHLARSFHHLFPVAPFTEVPTQPPLKPIVFDSTLRLSSSRETNTCFGCLAFVGSSTFLSAASQQELSSASLSSSSNLATKESLRFQCPECQNVFCVDCDTYLHDTLHNCPGCLLLK